MKILLFSFLYSFFFFKGRGGGGGGHQKSYKSRMLSTLSLFCTNFSAVGYAGIILFVYIVLRRIDMHGWPMGGHYRDTGDV